MTFSVNGLQKLTLLGVSILVLFAGLVGCKTMTPKAEAKNIYQPAPLPEHLRRVGLLPMHKGTYEHIDMASIEENFRAELVKHGAFEVVNVPREVMDELFGQESYATVELLPTKLLSKLYNAYAIDGVMMIDVSYYNAYQPVGLGVRAKLLDGHSGQIVWAADELFDSANPSVAKGAQSFFKNQSSIQYPLHKTDTVLHSPTRFSKFVAYSVFRKISLRKN